MKVEIETSARHIHLTQEDLEVLYGKGYHLTVRKELSQPGQFASNERLTIVGFKGQFAGVSILGPCRKASQVEISLTDARAIGVTAPVRESGDIAGSGSCKLVGPAGELTLKEGVIAAKRHIHMPETTAKELGVENGQIVGVRVESDGRNLMFDDVVVRANPAYLLTMHIDTDESNAARCTPGMMGEIIV
jgi:putative phosphotransacetylase